MTEVRLHRANWQGLAGGTICTKRLRQGMRLERITHGRARPVRLDKTHMRRVHAGVLASLAHQPCLGFRAGQRDAVGVTVLIEGGAADDAEDGVPIFERLAEPLEHDHAGAFAADEAIGGGVERLATSLRRKHGGLREADEAARGDHHGDAAGERGVAASGADVLARGVHGGQRGGAGGVHGDARAAQVEAIGDAVGRDAVGGAGGGVGADAGVLPWGALDALVIIVRDADEDADIGALFKIEHKAGVLHGLPRGFQQKPVLRVDVGSFARRNAEELGIELIDGIEKAAAFRD